LSVSFYGVPMNRMNLQVMEDHFRAMMIEGMGLDLNDPNLKDTPKRVAKMYGKELFHGVGHEFPEDQFARFPNDKNYDQMVMIDNIHFTSVCSHHFLPFSGRAWFAYIPGSHDVAGASKLPRLVKHYASRPQLQENLVHEIMNRFVEVMKPAGAMLVMRAIHGCMSCRGVEQYNNTGMISSAVYGTFKEHPETRHECLDLIQLSQSPL